MSRAGQLKSCTAGHVTSLIAEMCDFCEMEHSDGAGISIAGFERLPSLRA
jgi:hypothetical protein